MQITTRMREGHAVVRPSGVLSTRTVADLRLALLKAAAEQPESVVCDLGRVVVADRSSLTVLLAVSDQFEQWPACPLTVVAADPDLHAVLERVGLAGRIPVVAGLAEALEAVRSAVPVTPVRAVLRIGPGLDAPRRARAFVAAALRGWALPDADPDIASLVVDELVTNAVVHGRGEVEVLLSVRTGRLRVAVADAAEGAPRQRAAAVGEEGGRGLALVDALAERWGVVPWPPTGKVVWALLPREAAADQAAPAQPMPLCTSDGAASAGGAR